MMTTQAGANAPERTRRLRPDLSAEQKQHVVTAAAELIRAAVTARVPEFADPTLAGASEALVAGAFVSLKRNGHLRSCCGGLLDETIPLGKALQDAATRTALEDVRFPPVSPTELEHLEMEVWVLFNREAVQAKGESRIGAVQVGGKHGLVVARGQARGLLLPGVAVEHNWDSEQFLEQVCVKAGLHPTIWKDEETLLFTFEGEAIQGKVSNGDASAEATRLAPLFREEDLRTYAEFCRSNISLFLMGATPNYYLFGAPDGTVNGAALIVRRPRFPEPLYLSQLSLRPGVPLQSTLFTLSQGAARALAGQGIRADELNLLEVNLALLYDPAMHGTVARPHLAGIDPASRAVAIMERSKAGILYDPKRSAEALIAEATQLCRVRHASSAAIFSLEAQATESPVAISTAPRAIRGPAERSPGVAGKFYPADAGDLEAMISKLLAGDRNPETWPAAMVPHAGLTFSGHIAAAVLNRLQLPRTIIVLGPKHTPNGMEWAVAPQETWLLPGGSVSSDFKLARQLTQAIPGLELDAAAHQHEHAIEVELPFIARLAPETRVVGIALEGGDFASCRRFAEGLADLLRDREDRPLLLVSSDMNHFATDSENRRLDEMAITALERLDPEAVYETVTQNHISMCGLVPAVIVLETLRLLGCLHKAERVGYATSADVTGDTSRVVGYAGMLFG
jgi:AmmeMemoRadiSam system protein B/AmmeMemoRadiSam system protein A